MKGTVMAGIGLPLFLAVIGVSLILAAQLPVDRPRASLPGIPEPSEVAVVTATPIPSGATAVPTPSGTPIPEDWVAVQLEVASVALNVAVKHATIGQGAFPPDDAAYILYQSSEPGRGTNSYIVGHALQHLFKRLWNVQLGAEVKILMSDGVVLRYVVTEIHPNVSCPDERADPMPDPPLALQYAESGCPGARWAVPTDHERLTLQTSQGFNRNWGELILVAEPRF
jgi:hypothetical protein